MTAIRPSRFMFFSLSKKVFALAIPAFFTLIAEPLYLIADTAIIGHFGNTELAAIGISSVIIQTIIGLMVFLVYSVTSRIGQLVGKKEYRKALLLGRDALWLACIIGFCVMVISFFFLDKILGFFTQDQHILNLAYSYLLMSLLTVPAMNIVYAATGILRAHEDTKTPLIITTMSALGNIVLNYIFVYGFELSLLGSALGTVICSWVAVGLYLCVLIPRFRKERIGFFPRADGMKSLSGTGTWLVIRTLCLRCSLWATVFVASEEGTANIAAHHIVFTVWSFLAFALDSFAIAAQVLISHSLGASSETKVSGQTRTLVNLLSIFSVLVGVILGAILLIINPFIVRIFTEDTIIQMISMPSLILVALTLPLGALVFLLDGILIGADDTKYLAIAMIMTLIVYIFFLFLVYNNILGDVLEQNKVTNIEDNKRVLLWLWLTFIFGFLGMRAITLSYRVYSRRGFRSWTTLAKK